LDEKKLGLTTTVFVSIQIGGHSSEELMRFTKEVAAMDEVLDFYRLGGDVDFVLRVVVTDSADRARLPQRGCGRVHAQQASAGIAFGHLLHDHLLKHVEVCL
jgi:DNA-binding Lrp family transcriptional regulator